VSSEAIVKDRGRWLEEEVKISVKLDSEVAEGTKVMIEHYAEFDR
jgi:hypothetical protein